MKRTKRWLCLLLVFCMMLSVLPVTASAEGAAPAEKNTITIQVEDASHCTFTSSNSWETNNGSRKPNDNSEAGNGTFLFWQTDSFKEGDTKSITFALTGLDAGATYDLSVTTKDNPDRAKFQFSVNRTNVGGEVDLYSATTNGEFNPHAIGSVKASADGKIVLTATLTGKNAGNTGSFYGGAFDYFTLTKTSSGESSGETGGETPENPTQLYAENFNTAMPDGLGDSWERVELKDGTHALQGTKDGGGLLAALPMTNELPAEYTIVADVALVKGLNGSGYSAGVTFQQSEDGKNFYHFRLNRDGTDRAVDTQLYQWNPSPNKLESVKNVIPNYEDGQFHKLTVTVSGTKITGYVDETKAFDYTAVDAVSGGKLGLRVWNAVALFDNIVVTRGVQAPEEEQPDSQTKIFVNQIGYDVGTSMRATIPNVADGTEFKVVNKATSEAAYTGTVVGGIADFTGLTADTDTTFYITCADKQQSYDFEIGTNLIQRRSVKRALDFMVQTRSDTGVPGDNSIAWRDSHQFSFELNGLVLQYMANPSVYDNMPKTIFAEGTYVGKNKLTGTEYEDLKTQTEPDIIWLIKFAARRYYDWGCTEGKKLHMLTKEQLAYYLYLAPELIARGWETQDFYQKVRDYTISVWGENACNVSWYAVSGTDHNLYNVQKVFGGLKGSQPMGHSIVPNLMMYEVAKRDGLGDETANKFLTAAVDNCAYTVSNTDGNDICDPYFCKGQRMSEYVTIPALDYFVEMCPDDVDFSALNLDGLSDGMTNVSALKEAVKTKVAAWAKVNIARGDNLWDIRKAVCAADVNKYQFHTNGGSVTKEYWTGAAYAIADNQNPAPKNEPGNQAGLQAVMYAAARVLKDDATTTNRLHALGVAAIDDLFGRNPTGTAAFHDVVRDFTGGDAGWYKQYSGGAGRLEDCTAVIDANAPEFCYQNGGYNPSKDYQNNESLSYTEGWVAYNTAWNASLAYSQAENVNLTVDKTTGNVGNTVSVTLTAPINMNTDAQEEGTVQVFDANGKRLDPVVVKENGNNSTTFTGSFKLPNAESVTVSYGSGLFAHTQTITVTGYEPVKTTKLTLSPVKTEANVGETVKLTVEFTPENATDKTVDFTSSNADVATVDANGVVTAVAAGEVTITAKLSSDETITASVKLTVKEAEQSSKLEYGFLDLYLKGENVGYTYEGKEEQKPKQIEDHTEKLPTYEKDRVKLYDGTVTFELGEIPAGRYNVMLCAKYYPGGTDSNGTYSEYGSWTLKLNSNELKKIDFGTNETLGKYKTVKIGTVALVGGETTFTFVSDGTGPVVPVYVKFEPAEEVSKDALQAAITLAESKTEADYCAESWNAMQTALAAATAVNADTKATQDQVNTAAKNLTDALDALQAHEWSTAWSSNADNHWHECSKCHAKKDEDHHDWNNGEVTTKATCTTAGVKTYTCLDCGKTKTEAIQATGHTLTHHPATAPTELAEGNIEYWECSSCGKKFKNESCTEEVTNVTLPKLAPAPTPVIPVTPSEPAQNPFNPNAGSNVSKFPFVDVPSDSWYYSSVKAAWENGLIDGVTANEFKPNATLTVAQTIKLAAALHQLDRTGEVSLKNGGANWYDSYVNYAVTNGIIEKDYANYSKAQMNAPVTRGEFVHIFHGAEEAYKAINTVADNAIPDVKTTDKFAAEIYEFYRAGILTGSDAKGTFHSASTIKRSEAAAILLRMFETSARKSITLK